MTEENDIDRAAPSNGVVIPRKAKAKQADKVEASPVKPKASAPSPVDEPGKASAARRTESTEIHRSLDADDGERMYAVEVLEGETREALLFVVDMMLKLQGKRIDNDKLEETLSHETSAGFMVVETGHGKAIRARKLTRVQAIAYGLGGAGVDVFERMAAIQVTRKTLFAAGLILTQVVSVAVDANDAAYAKPVEPPIEVDPTPGPVVDARFVAEDGRE